jgi:hypothetical protein
LGLRQFVSKTPTGGSLIGSLSEVFEAMYHSILSYRGSQHRSQNANLNPMFSHPTQNAKLSEGWLTRHENDLFSSPSGNKYIK